MNMFDFNLNNPEGFLIAFIPSLLNFAIVGYIYFKLPENRLTNIFALLTLMLGFWQLNDAISRLCNTAEQMDMWDTILCPSWILVGPFCLHFALLYSSILKIEKSRTAYIFLYGPAIAFLLTYQAHIYPHVYIYEDIWGWVNFHDSHWIDVLQINWISILVISATIIIFYHAHRISKDKQLKKQTLIIATGIAVPTIAGVIGQVLLPVVLKQPAIPIASTFMSVFSLATVISLNKYRLFSTTDLVNNERLIAEMPLIIFCISSKSRLNYINKFTEDTLGIKKADLGTKSIQELLIFDIEEHRKNFYEAYHKSMKGEFISNLESGFIGPTGKICVEFSCKPIINNRQIQGVIFAASDITALKDSAEKIAYNEMLLADAQHISKIGSWEWDLTTNIVQWSDELFRIYGYHPNEKEINIDTFIGWLHPQDKPEVEKVLQASIKSRQPFSYYTRIIKKDSSIVTIHAKGRVITDKNNQAIKMSGTAQDVTEQKNKEETLKKQNEELKKINHELDKFVYSVSHDLRAPLLSMQGVIDITTEETREELTAGHMGMLKMSIKRLDSFIEDILDYSRNSRCEPKLHSVDFNELLSCITTDLKYMPSTYNNIDVQYEILNESTFYTDESRLSIILNNLISNAIRYHNPDSPNPFVKVIIDANEYGAKITVADNGIGISKGNQEKIFDMFYRVSENSTGSGLGLYIVKEAVLKLNGTITLDSVPSEGTRFHIEIPGLLYQ